MIVRTHTLLLTISKVTITEKGFEFIALGSVYNFTTKMDIDLKQEIMDELFTTGKVDLRKYQ